MKTMRSAVAVAALAAIALTGCTGGSTPTSGDNAASGGESAAASGEKVTLKVAALEGGYGVDMYHEVIKAYEAVNPNVTIDFKASKSIEDEISPAMKAGDFPDLVILGQGRQAALTESMVKDRAVADLSDVLTTTVPGEDVTVGDKLIDGITGNMGTNPYGDDGIYLMPMFYSPTGLVYNQTLLEENGWELPTTWDEMFKLGDQAKAKGISLFTYPTAGYMDSYFFSLLADVGGPEFYEEVMTYGEGVWKKPEARKALELTTKLLTDYANPDTVGYANEQDFTKNQQQILDGTTLFMPNGTWIAGEMADAPRTDGFEWGLSPLPGVEGDRYITTSIETAWIPTEAQHPAEAREFLAFLYSDQAAEIFAASNAIQPIVGMTEKLPEELQGFYQVYDMEGVKPIVGGFATTATVEGVDVKSTLTNTADSIITGDKTIDQWQEDLDSGSEAMRKASE